MDKGSVLVKANAAHNALLVIAPVKVATVVMVVGTAMARPKAGQPRTATSAQQHLHKVNARIVRRKALVRKVSRPAVHVRINGNVARSSPAHARTKAAPMIAAMIVLHRSRSVPLANRITQL